MAGMAVLLFVPFGERAQSELRVPGRTFVRSSLGVFSFLPPDKESTPSDLPTISAFFSDTLWKTDSNYGGWSPLVHCNLPVTL